MKRLLLRDFMRPDEHSHFASVSLAAASDVNEHTHDFAEVFLVLAGRGQHVINGMVLPLDKGVLVTLRPEDAHCFVLPGSDTLQIMNVAFRMNTWRALWQRYFAARDPMTQRITVRHRMLSLEEGHAVILAAEELRKGNRSRLQTDRFLLQVMETISGSCKQTPQKASLPQWLAAACEQMDAPRYFRGGTRSLAELTGRSAEHIARTLRRCLNQTPTQVINSARLNYAAERLANGDEKILKIALDCGLSNLSHFYCLFRQRYGVTPRAYRLLQRRVMGG